MLQFTAKSSGLKSADAVICDRSCRLLSVQVIADGTNAATAILYDNASAASGTVVSKIIVDATLTFESFQSTCGIECSNGLYLDVTGTGCEVVVHYALL